MIEKPIPEEKLDELRNIMHEALTKRFAPDGLTFDPIVFEHEIDYEGDELLWIKIIFDGDQGKLDARWTSRMPLLLDPALESLGLTAFPIISFIEKSEWEDPYYWIPDYLREDVEE